MPIFNKGWLLQVSDKSLKYKYYLLTQTDIMPMGYGLKRTYPQAADKVLPMLTVKYAEYNSNEKKIKKVSLSIEKFDKKGMRYIDNRNMHMNVRFLIYKRPTKSYMKKISLSEEQKDLVNMQLSKDFKESWNSLSLEAKELFWDKGILEITI